jgi:hypothetical protein
MARNTCLTFLCLAALLSVPQFNVSAADDSAFLGRWDITMPAPAGGRARYCWLEVTREDGKLKGRFNQGGGAVFDLPEVAIENGELRFQYPQGRAPNQTTAVYRATVKNGKLEGTATLGKDPTRSWTGVPGPNWPKVLPKRKPGKPVDLFNGKDLAGWVGQRPGSPLKWTVEDGILVNDAPANNIYSQQKFQDFKVEVEFAVDKGSNSGVYLRGRYEIQIADGEGRPLNVHSQGALYGYVVPPKDHSKPAGEWQTLEATIIQNRVTVVHNGVTIMENAEVPGITGGALDANEGEPGPIMIQGDHGKVKFRKIRVTPLV